MALHLHSISKLCQVNPANNHSSLDLCRPPSRCIKDEHNRRLLHDLLHTSHYPDLPLTKCMFINHHNTALVAHILYNKVRLFTIK